MSKRAQRNSCRTRSGPPRERAERDLLRLMAPPEVIPLMLQDKLLAQRLERGGNVHRCGGLHGICSGIEPDEVFSQLNEFFGAAGEIIGRYRGYINKTNGDGMMALFGVPFESATYRTDAVLAALAIQRETGTQFPFGMRIGINTGTVTAGMLGPPEKSLYDVIGDAVNLASRVEALCPRGGVSVSPSCEDVLKPWFQLDKLEEQEVEGRRTRRVPQRARLKPIAEDRRRVDPTSRFAAHYLPVIEEVEAMKRDRLGVIDFISLQARDLALQHNEAVASYAVALLRMLRADSADAERSRAVDEAALMTAALLHDTGKHAVEQAQLDDRSLDGAGRERLRQDLLDGTLRKLKQIGANSSAPLIADLYRFEATRGAAGRVQRRGRAARRRRRSRGVDGAEALQGIAVRGTRADCCFLSSSPNPDLVEFGQRSFKFVIEEPHRIKNFAEGCGFFCSVSLSKSEDAIVSQISHDSRVGYFIVDQVT